MNLYPSSCSSCCMCVYTHVYECIHIRISFLWLILSSACVHKRICIYTYIYVQPIAFEVSRLHSSQCHFFILKSTFGLVLYVSFATLCLYVYVYILYIFVYIFAYSASVGRDKGTHMHTHTRTHTHTYIHTHTKAYMRTPLVCS